MYSKINKILNLSLKKHRIAGETNIQLHVMLYTATVLCLAIHIIQLTIFWVYGVKEYVLLNIISIVMYCLGLLLCANKAYRLANVTILLEVGLYAFTVSVTSGTGTYVLCYYLFLVMLQVILPYKPRILKTGLIISIGTVLTANLLTCLKVEPVLIFPEILNNTFMIFNLAIVFIGVIVQLYIGGIIRYFIDQINENQMADLLDKANRDALTGLFNRRYANEVLPNLANDSRIKWCVAIIDIDDFKKINDTYGHDVGDIVLKHLSDMLINGLRQTDIVFRWGGEEFLVLLCDVNTETGFNILDKLRQKIAKKPLQIEGNNIQLNVTAGVTHLGSNVDKSIKLSDSKLYYGKKHGKNVVIR